MGNGWAVWRSLGEVIGLGLLLAACVTGQNETTTSSSPSAVRSCENLTDARRDTVRRLDAVEHGRQAPNATAALYMLALLGGNPANIATIRAGDASDRQRALDELRATRVRLDQQIDDQQCTVEARAKAGAIKPLDRPDYDGVYVGKGSAESWCAPPSLSLSVQGGQVTGTIRGNTGFNARFEVEGKVYEDGTVALKVKRPESSEFTDDFDGRFTADGLSFVAKLDASAKACTWRFAVARPAASPAVAAGSGAAWTSGSWKANTVLLPDKSASNCSAGKSTFTLDLEDSALTVSNQNGRVLVTKVAPDGAIDGSFRSSSGVNLQIVGNARRRDIEIINGAFGCRWKLADAPPKT